MKVEILDKKTDIEELRCILNPYWTSEGSEYIVPDNFSFYEKVENEHYKRMDIEPIPIKIIAKKCSKEDYDNPIKLLQIITSSINKYLKNFGVNFCFRSMDFINKQLVIIAFNPKLDIRCDECGYGLFYITIKEKNMEIPCINCGHQKYLFLEKMILKPIDAECHHCGFKFFYICIENHERKFICAKCHTLRYKIL